MKHRTVIAVLVIALCLWVGCTNAFADQIVWETDLDTAIALGKAQGKKILLVGGDKDCAVTQYMKQGACESVSPPIKSVIEQYFIPWYSERSDLGIYFTQWSYYAKGIVGSFNLPLICVIDPNDSGNFLDRTTGKQDLQVFYSRLLQYSTPQCTLTISPSVSAFNASSSTGTINVTSSSNCSWTALSNASWITIPAGSAGTGDGTVSYSVSANTTGITRTGTLTIGGHIFTVTQNGATTCASTISPTSASFGPPGHFGDGTNAGNVAVTTSLNSCSWSATSNAPWITITSGSAGTGNGTVSYSASANTTGITRTGTMTIGEQTFTITQNGPTTCAVTISPTSSNFGNMANTGMVAVTPSSSSCSWSATSNALWITITAGSAGTGNGTVSYSASANTTGITRTGTITIGGQTFTVTQNSVNAYFDTVQKIYIGYYQRPADPAGLIYWADRLNASNGNLSEIIDAFSSSFESRALYGTITNSNISTVVNNIYLALFNRDADEGGLNYYVNGFNTGQFTPATIMSNILNGAQGGDLQSVNNKLTAANLFTRTIDPELDGSSFQGTYAGDGDVIAARNFLALYATSVKVPTQAETTAFIIANIADSGDPILDQPNGIIGPSCPMAEVVGSVSSTIPGQQGGTCTYFDYEDTNTYQANSRGLGNYHAVFSICMCDNAGTNFVAGHRIGVRMTILVNGKAGQNGAYWSAPASANLRFSKFATLSEACQASAYVNQFGPGKFYKTDSVGVATTEVTTLAGDPTCAVGTANQATQIITDQSAGYTITLQDETDKVSDWWIDIPPIRIDRNVLHNGETISVRIETLDQNIGGICAHCVATCQSTVEVAKVYLGL